MAHLLESDRSMAYVGDKPWHGLGIEVQGEQGMATVDAFVQALPTLDSGIDYEQAVAFVNGQPVTLDDTFAVVRSLDSKVIGVVGNQARQSNASPSRLVSIISELAGGRNVPSMSTAGFLRNGSVMWAAMRLGRHSLTAGNGFKDESDYYFTLSTAFDNSMATGGQVTSVRVVCNNTLSMARRSLGGDAADVRVKHTKSHEARLVNATETWKQALADFETFKARTEALAALKVSDAEAQEVLKALLGAKGKAEVPTRTQNNLDKIMGLYQGDGQGSNPWTGTAWGLLNAVTEYADHHSVVRGARTDKGIVDGAADRILDSVMFGNAADLKAKAFDALTGMLG